MATQEEATVLSSSTQMRVLDKDRTPALNQMMIITKEMSMPQQMPILSIKEVDEEKLYENTLNMDITHSFIDVASTSQEIEESKTEDPISPAIVEESRSTNIKVISAEK